MTPITTSPYAPEVVDAALNDRDRLEEIAALQLTSPAVDAILQDTAKRAAEHFGLPIGLVSIVLDEAQYFAASHGLGGWIKDTNGTPVEWSFCRFAVSSKDAFVVEDATEHELVQDNPLVSNDGIRCYAGIPLISSKGHALGSFCVIGTEARTFSAEEMAELRGFAAEAVAQIETRRVA
jgi:GAF domain-containing protein